MGITYENINNSILTKAKLILSKKAHVKEYIEICIRAKVCPECGKEDLKIYEKSNSFDCECLDCNWHYNVSS